MIGPDDEAWLASATALADSLPHPTTERWQPLRLGLVDLFYYDDEQFWFHDGRLLLRGNNGTGKSKVLALTLPFLLDGSVLPRRVEPDADPKKRMEWNLLLGGTHPHNERTGYAWVEFGRRDTDGSEYFTTLGIGMKAAAGRGLVKTWYFTTTRRIGDLRLLDATRTVLTAERLRDELVGSGQVHSTQEAYRRAVDEALFRLGEERYAALIDLLIQLRQPQLSKRPDEKALSAALTEALAPLDQAVVADVAESFRSLEEERVGIADAKDTLGAAEDFLKHYRTYAKVAARRRTTAVRTANSVYEWAGRDLREVEAELAEASAEVAQLAGQQEVAGQRQGVLQGQEQALRASPEMREADRLDQAETAATDVETRATAAETDVGQADTRARQEAEKAQAAVRRHGEAARVAEQHETEAQRLAGEAGLVAEHPQIAVDAESARRALTRRREQITHVRSVARESQNADARADQQRSALDAAEATAAGRAEDVRAAGEGVAGAAATYGDRVRDYLGELTVIAPEASPDELASAAEDWARSLEGESPARAAVETAAATALQALGRRRAAAEHEATRLSGLLEDVTARIAELESGRDPEPPGVPGRDPRAREGAAGAPLWRVTDFAEGVPDADRVGVEAALQSAGLLDAWLFPDGSVQAAGDVVLGPAGPAPAGASLGAVLVPAVGPDAGIPETVVVDVLARIGLGEESGAAVWVDRAGQWGAGPARGSWAKQRAEYVGASAREAYRREVLAGLRDEHAALDEQVARTRESMAALDRQVALVLDERAGYPAQIEHDLVAAHERVAAAERELAQARAGVATAQETWERAASAAGQARAELAEAAASLGTGTTHEELDQRWAAVGAYAEALVELRASAGTAAAATTAREEATERAAEAAQTLEERTGIARELRTKAATLRARADALRESARASVAELQARLDEITAELTAVAAGLKRVVQEQLKAAGRHGMLEEKVRDLGQRREETAAAREREIVALRTFVATGVLRVALPELAVPDPAAYDEWNLTAALSLSRTAEQQLEATDESDDAWSRVQQRVSTAQTELAAQMSRHGHTAWVEQHGDVLVARVRYLADEVDIDRLVQRLATDVADRERLLSAREREILENHLVNEVAGHLHELLLAAEGQIDRMNRELAERKTSTGMQLRVRWRGRVDGPAGLNAARDLMVRSDATWTPADRAAIGDFLQARIAEVRDADPTSGWQEHLEQALDYRQWHSFVVERWQHGQWRSASGPASSGEKVLAVSVPLFAAAASHYNSAGPHAPRLILLDEAFAGVDDDSRAKSLGLLATFDLDVVMTSEREWGCYPQVPGLAIAQLSRVEGVDAVGVTRWRWDGRRRERLGEVDEAARAGAGDEDQVPDASLFE